MKNKFLKISFSFLAFLLMFSCDSNDDYTSDSVVKAVSPSLAVSLSFANETTLIEQEASYMFSVAITEAQIADVIVNLAQTDGTATAGEDFTMPSSVTIKRGTLSASGEITILADELAEETETVTIQIGLGNESNVSGVTSETVTFNIANLTEGDLVVGMSWAAAGAVTDNYGTEIGAYDLGDLRLLLTDVPYTSVLDGADGAVAETYTLDGGAPDGEYYIVADFYAAMDIPADLDITLTFDQVGVMNAVTSSFPAAINTGYICENNYVLLTKITKSGTNYTLTDAGMNNIESQSVTWGGIDTYDYYAPDGWESKITTAVDCGGKLISGLNAEWMLGVWGEVIESEELVYYTVDASGNITVPFQELFTTSFNGGLYDYQVSATGTYDDSGDVPVVHLEYTLIQDGFDVGAYWQAAGGMATPYFVADLIAN